jgi:hypothetical protein
MKMEHVIRAVGDQPASTLAQIASPRDNRTVLELLEVWAVAIVRRNIEKMCQDLSYEHLTEVEYFVRDLQDAHGYNA